MKKNYLSPAIETTVLGYSLMQTTDPSANSNITNDNMGDAFGAPKRRTQPF